MMFSTLGLLSFAGVVVAARHELEVPTGDIPAASRLGSRILSKARALDGDNDYTWVSGYSIKFHSCISSPDYYGGYFAGNGDQNGQNGQYAQNNGQYAQNGQNGQYNYGNGNNRNDYNGIYEQRLVHFKLCPSNSCLSCPNSGDYVVEMGEFVNAVMEAKLAEQQYNCEQVKENCYCDNAYSEESCLASCYKNAKLSYCQDDQQGGKEEDFKLEEALQCTQLKVDEQAMEYYYYKNRNGNQANYQNNDNKDYYVGPYCASSGRQILLGVFTDETCTYPATKGIYEQLNYGQKLPYSQKSLVDYSCISCLEPGEYNGQGNWDAENQYQVTEVCAGLYEEAGKCEENLNIYYPNVLACDYIKTLGDKYIMPTALPAKVLAGVFAATTAILGGVAYYLYHNVKRSNVNLSGQGGIMS